MNFRNLIKPKNKRSSTGAFLVSDDAYETLCVNGYTSLDRCPEVMNAVNRIADIISSMTIYLMANTKKGDERIINELSRKVDILPNRWMTRRTWMSGIVANMLLYGKGNAVVIPHTDDGYLGDLEPIDAARVNFLPVGSGYQITIDGVPFNPDNLLHFVYNPDPHYLWKGQGVTVALKDVCNNLKQEAATTKAFLSSKWKPTLIIKVDALTEEFASKSGRKKLLDEYIETSEVGEPWMIPAEQFSVEQVRPLSLADLAISEVSQMDKKTVAAMFGVPPFVLGIGEYKDNEWNAFINNTIRPIAQEIEQELTRKLLISEKMYWKFNITSLYSYDLEKIEKVYSDMYIKGLARGNEVRDKMNLEPMDGLDDLVILENYLPIDRLGDQKKLIQHDEGNGGNNE